MQTTDSKRLELAKAIRHEHNATMEAARRSRASALHLGTLLLDVRQAFGKAKCETWLRHRRPIPEGAAKRYANEAKRLKLTA